ncbi:MAG: AraC family transcriptional regulator [Butyrivibrio sp.]|nr:AraC family transcriptional regulator [Butyrivibrio sp.]
MPVINAHSREDILFDTLDGVLLYHNHLNGYPQHWHNEVELVMPITGAVEIQFHNDSSVVKRCGPGDIMLIAPGTLHEYLETKEGGEKLILLFDIGGYSQVSSLVPLLKTLPPYVRVRKEKHPEEAERLKGYFYEIQRLYGESDEFLQISVYSLVTLMLAQIGSMHLTEGAVSADPEDTVTGNVERLVAVTNYIDSHCNEEISVDSLAEMAGFSKYHFERLFKSAMGISCYRYITKRRMMMAKQLLGNSSLSVMEVAMQSGFFSLSTFNRVFKDSNGCSPTEFRKLYLSDDERKARVGK